MDPDKIYFSRLYSKKNYSFKFNYDKGILEDVLKYKKTGKVLDLGCGEAGLSLALAEKGCDVTCIDISKSAISAIKKEAKKRRIKINAICADLENYKINEEYDVILCLGILQFLGKKGQDFVRKIKRHTKKGGINIIDAFVNNWLPKGRLKGIYTDWKISEFEEYFEDKKSMNYITAQKS